MATADAAAVNDARLVARGVGVRVGERAVLQGIDLSVGAGEAVALVGPNGAGKSTLLRTLAGLLPTTTGTVQLMGQPLAALPSHERARKVAVLTQRALAPEGATVLSTVLLGRSPWLGPFGLPGASDEAQARTWLDRLEIGALADRPMATLSGGEQQRAQLARVLVQQTPVVLLDEPISAQDVRGVALWLRCLAALRDEGRTVVVVLHDLGVALGHFERLVVLESGCIRADGTPEAAATALQDVYGPALQLLENAGRRSVYVSP